MRNGNTVEELAQLAYITYHEAVVGALGSVGVAIHPPDWDSLTIPEKAAWEASTCVVVNRASRRKALSLCGPG